MSSQKKWENYEQVTRQMLLDLKQYFGLDRVEEKGKLKGISGEEWGIDVIAYKPEPGDLVIVECKQRSSSRIDRSTIAGFAYVIRDTQAKSGIFVISIGLQEGAKRLAEYENILVIELKVDITDNSEDYIAKLANDIFGKVTDRLALRNFDSDIETVYLDYSPPEKFYDA